MEDGVRRDVVVDVEVANVEVSESDEGKSPGSVGSDAHGARAGVEVGGTISTTDKFGPDLKKSDSVIFCHSGCASS